LAAGTAEALAAGEGFGLFPETAEAIIAAGLERAMALFFVFLIFVYARPLMSPPHYQDRSGWLWRAQAGKIVAE
jgi:hypothetical protein